MLASADTQEHDYAPLNSLLKLTVFYAWHSQESAKAVARLAYNTTNQRLIKI
jgi:hypothetical protein